MTEQERRLSVRKCMIASAEIAAEHWREARRAARRGLAEWADRHRKLSDMCRREAMRIAHEVSVEMRAARTVICEPF